MVTTNSFFQYQTIYIFKSINLEFNTFFIKNINLICKDNIYFSKNIENEILIYLYRYWCGENNINYTDVNDFKAKKNIDSIYMVDKDLKLIKK